jgi:hypothetical protein
VNWGGWAGWHWCTLSGDGVELLAQGDSRQAQRVEGPKWPGVPAAEGWGLGVDGRGLRVEGRGFRRVVATVYLLCLAVVPCSHQ